MTDQRTVTAARKSLGRQLAELRNAVALTQSDLAELTSFSRSTVANVEAGYQAAGPKFWRKCDEVLGTGGSLRVGYDELEELGRELHRTAARAAHDTRQSVIRQSQHDGASRTSPPSIQPAIADALTTLAGPGTSSAGNPDDLETRVLRAYQLHRGAPPGGLSLVLVGGFAGSGKSEFARFLSAVTAWTMLDKDTLTRALVEQLLVSHGCDANDRHTPHYVDHVRPLEYRCLVDAAVENLRCGISTVVTAPFVREFASSDWYTRLRNRCSAHRARLSVVWMRCDEASMRDYMAYRGAARDAWKLANWQDYLATIDLDFVPPFDHHNVDNRLNAAIALADQAREIAAQVNAK